MKLASLSQFMAAPLLTTFLIVGAPSLAFAEEYQPPPGLGSPGRRESAGTRGCVFGTPATLVALMPENNVGWTTAAYPRFYWYLPVNQAQFVEFTLEKPAEGTGEAEIVYWTRFAVTGEAGIVSLQLPEAASLPPLTVGDRYRWQVAVFCNPNSETGDLQVEGWVERQTPDPDLAAALASASPSEQVGLYAANGYWFDALDRLATLPAEAPEAGDRQGRWAELLESVGLGAIADQPLMVGDDVP